MRSILKKGSAYGFKSMTTTVRFNAGSHHDVKSHDSHDAHHEHDSHAVEIKPDQPFWPNDICENDYKAFEHLFHNPATKESPYALHNLVANSSFTTSKGFLKFLQKNLAEGKTEHASDFFRPPQIHENSVFIYQSRQLANAYRFERASEATFGVLALGLMHEPMWLIPAYGLFYILYGRAGIYEKCRRFVTRMDFLPHLEMVHFQKITTLGVVYSKLVRTSDLEYVDFEGLRESENWFWGINGNIDKYLIFRDKKTDELFVFDRDGYWDAKGLEHELLN